jgi:hypothetical protein
MRRLLAAMLVGAAFLGAAGVRPGAATPPRPWLWQCEQIGLEQAKDACYVRLLLQDVDRSGDPARELPRIDRRARAADTSLLGRCHMLMHEVGRRFARSHHVTLANLMRFVPRSSDPGCSAGFGMGLSMALGREMTTRAGAREALGTCLRLPTRYRSYTCVHGLGHALMRGYDGSLPLAVQACRDLGPAAAPDCAQGAFHDYWISLRGADETTRPAHAIDSARTLCARYPPFARPCWYRFFVEHPNGAGISTASDMRRACRGLAGGQRSGCIAGASLLVAGDPVAQTALCSRLGAADAVSCVHGIAVESYVGQPRNQLRLLEACAGLRPGARAGCYTWYGRTLAVVTNGASRRADCGRLAPLPRRDCLAGARRMGEPLGTFS